MLNQLNVVKLEKFKPLEPGTVVLFSENYVSAFGVVIKSDPWIEMALKSGEYSEYSIKEAKSGCDGYPIVVLGVYYGCRPTAENDKGLEIVHSDPRRFVFYKFEHRFNNRIYTISNPILLENIFDLNLFESTNYGGEYLSTIAYDLLVLNAYLSREKNDGFSTYGDKLVKVFAKGIGRKK
jgi:hypothetical protein